MKNKLGVVLVTFIFSFSSFAYLLSIGGGEEVNLNIAPYTNKPLKQSDIMKILRKDDVFIMYVWSFDCENCEEYENELINLMEKFNGRVYLNSLNTYYYPDIPILDIPYLKIIGRNGEKEFKITLPNATELEENICSLFENMPEMCNKILKQ